MPTMLSTHQLHCLGVQPRQPRELMQNPRQAWIVSLIALGISDSISDVAMTFLNYDRPCIGRLVTASRFKPRNHDRILLCKSVLANKITFLGFACMIG